MCIAFTKKQSVFPPAGRAHCAMHRVRAREYGLVRTCTDLYGRWAQGYVGAVRSGNSKAHSCGGCWLAKHIAQCTGWEQRMSDRSDLSDDWHRVQSVPCALEFSKYIALTQPSAMSVSVRISPYSSVFPCPQYRHCAMCFASLPEAREPVRATADSHRGRCSAGPALLPQNL